MNIKQKNLIISLMSCLFIFKTMAMAEVTHHAFIFEGEVGNSQEGTSSYNWDLDGWIGGDYNKLWLKLEGEKLSKQSISQSEFWALYSRNIASFWDAQIGIRYDNEPKTTYFVAGVTGLAPYFFETEAHVFISDKGNVLARLRQENELLITQRLILQPYFEINLSAQNIRQQEIGAGFVDGEIGIQTRYEFTRKFAPYFDLRYESKFGKTATFAKQNNEKKDDFIISIGLRLMF